MQLGTWRLLAVAGTLAMGLNGAAAQGQAITGRDWSVVSLAGTQMTGDRVPTLTLAPDGRMSGFAGCNRYTGSYRLEADLLTPGPAAATRMACPPPMMATEQLFFSLIAGPLKVTSGSDGTLVLTAGDGRQIVAR